MPESNIVSLNSGIENPPSECTPPCFADFWTLYPRRVAKLAARKAWERLPESSQVAALTALVEWRRVWANKDLEYVPHPATWLNGERWEDELPPGYAQRPQERPVSGPPRADQENTVRHPIPEHVRALLARLRGEKKPAS